MRRLNAWEDPLVRRRWRLILAASELGGGVFGAVMFTMQGLATARPVWHTVAALLFCTVSALAGWRLLRRQSGGLALSAAVQAAQVVWVWGPTAAYRVTSGLALVGIYTTERGPDAIVGATAAFRLGLPDSGAGLGAGVNFFAVLALLVLAQLYRAAARPADVVDAVGSVPSVPAAPPAELAAPAAQRGVAADERTKEAASPRWW
jgi:hypothetical protein